MKITKAMGRGALRELRTGRLSADATEALYQMGWDGRARAFDTDEHETCLALAMIVAISGIKVKP